MNETNPLLSKSVRQLAETLRALEIKYALVGGVAVALVARPRFTADVDAIILNVDDRLEWLIEKLVEAGYETRARDQVAFSRRTRVLTLHDPGGVGIDLMMGLLPFDEALVAQSNQISLTDGTRVAVASVEHLLVMKAVAWRPKDIEDIRELVAINPIFDRDFVLQTFTEYAELLEIPGRVGELSNLLNQPT